MSQNTQFTPKLEAETPGVLQVDSLRHILVHPDLLGEIQKGVEDRLGAKAGEFLYSAGAYWSSAIARRLKAASVIDEQELLLLFCSHATEMGWGRWQLEGFSADDKRLMIRVQHSPAASAYGESDLPVCHLLAGAVSGLAEFLLNMPCACNESSCAAQGGPDCLFVAQGQELAGGDGWEW